ncbi:MAG: hypothetical protein AB7F86_08575 [Bdellovibrionales bacterium]
MKTDWQSHPLISEFLDRLVAPIRNSKTQAETREEILAHLEDALEGVKPEDESAILAVLSGFGDPRILGRRLLAAQRHWLDRLLRWTLSCAALGAFGLYIFAGVQSHRYEQKLSQMTAKVVSRIPRFQADQHSLSQYEFLRETRKVKADAGVFLNSKISWNSNGTNSLLPEFKDPAWNADWLHAKIPLALQNVDLNWIHHLHSYDHWDLFVHGPNAKYIGPRAKPINPYSVPIADMSFLGTAAKLHLRTSLENHEIIRALKDVRHLARLTYTTEVLIGSMVAVSLLKIERAAYEEAVRRGLLVGDEFEVFDANDLDKMKTTLWVAAGFANLTSPGAIQRTFLNRNEAWPVGSCAALAEASQAIPFYATYLSKMYPFEDEPNERITTLQQAFEASKPHCRLILSRQIMDRPKDYGGAVILENAFSLATGWDGMLEKYRFTYGRYVPFLRQSLGLEMLAFANVDFTSLYEHQ